MPFPLRALLFAFALVPVLARAEAIAPTTQPSSCLDPDVQVVSSGAQGGWLYRIVFRNRCDAQRSLY